MGLEFKFIVEGDHPVFKRIDRKCITLKEAENVADGLEAIGYEVGIFEIENRGYGQCPDCIWRGQPNGCNVKRDSEICKLNYKLNLEGIK